MTSLWAQDGWRDEVDAWVAKQLTAAGLEQHNQLEEFKLRPWSANLRVQTSAGYVYFKALPPGLEHEVGLTFHLSTNFPEHCLRLLGHNSRRGWMLTLNGGESLHDSITPELAKTVWPPLLTGYAELQVQCAAQVQELLALGVPDRRLSQAANIFDQSLALAPRFLGLEGFSAAELDKFSSLRPWVLSQSDKLASLGIPESLQHDDLHDRNILLRDGRTTVFDWGDACISHPFFSLRESLFSIAESLALAYLGDPPELDVFRDAYLAPWTSFAPRDVLLEAVHLAKSLSVLPPIVGWVSSVANATLDEQNQTAEFVVKLYRELTKRAGEAPA